MLQLQPYCSSCFCCQGSKTTQCVFHRDQIPPLHFVQDKKAADLSRREAELNRKEAELRKLELELRNNPSTKSVKNWPKFCPVVHHDIAGEIPAQNQGFVRFSYYCFVVSAA